MSTVPYLWWFDPQQPLALSVSDVDDTFNHDSAAILQQSADVVNTYVSDVLEYVVNHLNHPVQSIIEFGGGVGQFTMAFRQRGIDAWMVEGSAQCIQIARENGVPEQFIFHADLRRPLPADLIRSIEHAIRKFDLAICTEVAEHLEVPFSGQLVSSLTSVSDYVWFSSCPPGIMDACLLKQHCNEQPTKFWQILFEFNGFEMIQLPRAVHIPPWEPPPQVFRRKS